MIHYIDTSAFVKRYSLEKYSDHVQRAIEASQLLVTSVLTELEMISWIERAKKGRAIDSPSYRALSAKLDKDFHKSELHLMSISNAIMREAKRIIRQRRLRSPDAIQLATALGAQRQYPSSIRLLCFDHDLNEAARLEGLKCAGL